MDPISFLAAFALAGDPDTSPAPQALPVVRTEARPTGRLIIVDPPPPAPLVAQASPSTNATVAEAPEPRLCTCDHDGACIPNVAATLPAADVVRQPVRRAPAVRATVPVVDDEDTSADAPEPPTPPAPPPKLWRLADSSGQAWDHPDPEYLKQWVAGRNAALASPWQAQVNWPRVFWGGMFRTSACGPGGCP